MDPLWFSFDEDDPTPATCAASQREFLRLVRAGAADWPCRPDDTFVLFFPHDEPDDDGNTAEHDEMRLVVDLPWQRVHGFAVGACLEADSVLCTELHLCSLQPTQEWPGIEPRRHTGPPRELAAFTLDWIGDVLRRPDLRYDRR
ncbi:hypothetical protein [Streptomyces sp. CA2R106]|uniref:hypothetical protein n=1 Tax=Streptomyces sp. CA2R106 TaxID=3120153 RepID=UPI00300ADEFF